MLTRFIESKPVLRELFANVFVAGLDGQVLAYADASGVHRSDIRLAVRAYFRRTIAEGRPIVSDPIPGRISGGPVVALTQPVRNASGVYAVIGGSLRLADRDLLADLVDTHAADSEVLLVVTDAKGRVIAHPDRSRLMHSLAEEPRLAHAFKTWVDGTSAVEPEGVLLPQPGELVSAAAVAGPDWVVWRARPERDLLQPLHAARKEAMMWAIALIAAMSAVLFAFLSWRLRPLGLLEQRALHMFDGSLGPQEAWPTAQGEIGRLGRVLCRVSAERAELEERNNHALRRLSSVMGSAPIGIAFTRDERFELVSAELCRMFGRSESKLLGQATQVVFASNEDYNALRPQSLGAFALGAPYVGEWRMLHSDGTSFWARLRGKPVDAGDVDAGVIWTMNDISDQMAQREHLEWSATHDSLTGLANRKHFETQATRLLNSPRESTRAVVVFIDLDHFKPINDSAGHAAGDAMLRAVATAITSRVRAADVVVRLGGDEFALLLERCPREVALRVAENVRAAISEISLPWEGRTLHVGASLGVAALTQDTASVEAWLEAADAACYEAKAAGRGVVKTATGVELRVVANALKKDARLC